MKVMVWFYNHRNELGHLMDYTLTVSEEESDDDGAVENRLDDEEDTLDKVGEIKLSRISLSLKCLVVVVVIEQLAKSAVDVSCQNLKPIHQHINRAPCEENYYFLCLVKIFSLVG